MLPFMLRRGDHFDLDADGEHLLPIHFHPVTGEKIEPTDIYDLHETINVILFNPWSGEKRDPLDVNNDIYGLKSMLPNYKTGFELLIKDIRDGKPSSEILESFEKNGWSPDYIYGSNRFSFLMYLAYHGYEDLFVKYFKLSSSKDHKSLHGETVFHLSVRYPRILEFLLSTGDYKDVDINYQPYSNNAIIIAASNIDEKSPSRNRIESIKMLVDAGGDINHKNSSGRTALMNAASSGDYEFVEFLLSLGADKTVRDDCGHDAKHYSCMYVDKGKGIPFN